MREIVYEFADLDSDESFRLLGKSFGGILQNKALYFDNDIAKGELIKTAPDEGMWIRKWTFNVFQKIILRKLPAPANDEKKFYLIYFLNPPIFKLKNNSKKILVNSHHNIMFYSSDAMMDFSDIPKQPFYVLDISFTASWLLRQFVDAAPSCKELLEHYVNKKTQTTLMEPCCVEEYKILHELEVSMLADKEDVLFIRSRIYKLIFDFFSKLFHRCEANLSQGVVHYEQIMQAEMIIMADVKKPPKIEAVARKVNMSVSSLLRQFKLIYGKSIHEYYVAKKLELAKKLLLEKRVTVKEMAEMLGYRQASPFIEIFSKQYGYSPGMLKSFKSKPSFS